MFENTNKMSLLKMFVCFYLMMESPGTEQQKKQKLCYYRISHPIFHYELKDKTNMSDS